MTKRRSDCRERFHFNSCEVKQGSVSSQRFHFSNSDEVKQGIERCHRFPFNSSAVNRVLNVVGDVISILVNLNSGLSVVRDFILIVMN